MLHSTPGEQTPKCADDAGTCARAEWEGFPAAELPLAVCERRRVPAIRLEHLERRSNDAYNVCKSDPYIAGKNADNSIGTTTVRKVDSQRGQKEH